MMPPRSAPPADIKVIASPAIRGACLELVPAFESARGRRVTTEWAGTVDIVNRIGGGETVDVVIASAASLDRLTRQGRIVPGSTIVIARCGIGAAVKAGAPKPDISSGDALGRALLAAKSIGCSTGPSGVYLDTLFKRLGVADRIAAKLVRVPIGQLVGEAVARGEAELGFQQASELLPVGGIDFVGPLSSDVQEVTVFSAGLHTDAAAPDAAKDLLEFLRSSAAIEAITRSGMQPG